MQPLTVGAWADFNDPIQRRMMELSDVISYHGYNGMDLIEAKLKICGEYARPVICTEWLLRQGGNTVATMLPVFHARKIGCYNWGLVAGRTQTYFHGGSPQGPRAGGLKHDLFRRDGTPYSEPEVVTIRACTGVNKKAPPPLPITGKSNIKP